MPAIVGELAEEVTAGTTTDYDALVALQRWFRSGEFEYSRKAPVEPGFDGDGLEAMGEFLEVRSGYCTHFASSFVMMARILHMPARVVNGYLPGTSTGESVDGQTVYSVMSSQRHAWPEVYFAGIGWVRFEATPGLGVPTTFAPASVPLDPDGRDVEPKATDESTPAPSPSIAPGQPGGPPLTGSAAPDATAVNLLPGLATGLSIALLLAIPAVLRAVRARTRVSAANAGDAGAAWRELQDTALDLGIRVPASETPRALGARLVSAHGAPHDAVAELVHGIERASYARGGQHEMPRGPQLADAVVATRAAMLAGADGRNRVLAIAAPRSLVIRPGSVHADSAVGADIIDVGRRTGRRLTDAAAPDVADVEGVADRGGRIAVDEEEVGALAHGDRAPIGETEATGCHGGGGTERCGGRQAGSDEVLQFLMHAGTVCEATEEGQRLRDVRADEQVDSCRVESANGGQNILEPTLRVVVEAAAQGRVPFRGELARDPRVVREGRPCDAHHGGVEHHAGDDEGTRLCDGVDDLRRYAGGP